MTNKNKLEGKLTDHYETGMEGIGMFFEDNLNKGYDSLHVLKAGYTLTVYDKNKEVYYSGEITKKMAELYSNFFKTGYQDKKWTKMFYDKMDAELIKKQ